MAIPGTVPFAGGPLSRGRGGGQAAPCRGRPGAPEDSAPPRPRPSPQTPLEVLSPCRVHCPLVQARLEVSDSFQPPPVCRKRHRAQRSRRNLCIRWQNAIPPEPGKDDCGCPCRPPSAGRCQNGLSESGRSLTVSPENELEEILWLRGGALLGQLRFRGYLPKTHGQKLEFVRSTHAG